MARVAETNSLEVRWFGTGRPPDALAEWLADLGAVETATRTDLYVAPPAPNANLKFRGGKAAVELKRRLGDPERRAFAPDVAGVVEQWYKWRFPLDDDADEVRPTGRTGLWLPVEKERTLHSFGETTRHAAVDLPAAVTAHAEVTAVTTPSATAWTCGLEATGPSAELDDAFGTVTDAAFDEGFPVALRRANSRGYAAWLRERTGVAAPEPAVLSPSRRP